MITYFYKTMSLGNLQRAGRAGQIATILLFIMVIVLVFILVTANIGQLSVTTTNLANAADNASLYLASHLGTRAALLERALSGKKCKQRGLGGTMGGILGAMAAIILAPFPFGASLNLSGRTVSNLLATDATLGKTIGGTIGGAIAGSAAAQGALQGVETGFAIGRVIKRAADITRNIAKTIK